MRTIRTTGRIAPDDNRLYRIQAGFDGWVDVLADTPPGSVVKRDQVLATLYGPEVRTAELNYIAFMAGMERVRQGMADGDTKSLDDSKHVNEEQLRLLGMGEEEIDRCRRTTTPQATSTWLRRETESFCRGRFRRTSASRRARSSTALPI